MHVENFLWSYTLSWLAAYRAMAEQAIAGCDLIETMLRPQPVQVRVSENVVAFPMDRVRRPRRRFA